MGLVMAKKKAKAKKASALSFGGDVPSYVIDGMAWECSRGKWTYTARIVSDEDMGPPWEEHDGHGPVSEWTTRAKRPGERVLNQDGNSRRYYDFQEAVKIAKRDGWGPGSPSAAAERDFEALRAWCNDEWRWVGVVVSVSYAGVMLSKHAASLWGIECNYPGSDNSYLLEVANELLEEAAAEGRRIRDAVRR